MDVSDTTKSGSDDGIPIYYSNVMKTAMLEQTFRDAVKEMDGDRLLRLWKFILTFSTSRMQDRVKYALEAFNFLAD